eukprot:gene33499-44856_t
MSRRNNKMFFSSDDLTPSGSSGSKERPSPPQENPTNVLHPGSGEQRSSVGRFIGSAVENQDTNILLQQFFARQGPLFKSRCNLPQKLTAVQRLSHKALTLQFLVDFYEEVVKPLDPKMTTKRVADELFKAYTKDKGGGSVMGAVLSDIYVDQIDAFISHANDNEFVLLVHSLIEFFKDAVWAEIFIYIDIFTINQNNVLEDLQDGETLKATIENSKAVLVVLDERAYPLTRLWCLYEIGSTPIEKLILLTHGLDPSQLARAYKDIDSSKADCWAQSDKEMIRQKVQSMLFEQRVISQEATVAEALTAFTRVLKLLLLL